MSSWMDAFLQQALSPIPDPVYRRRAEQELTDHLMALATDLQAAGYSAQEARSAALAQMGDPAELAQHYAAQWQQRLRSPRYRAARSGYFLTLACYFVLMAAEGLLYIANAPNFGTAVVGLYGAAAVPMAAVLLLVLILPKEVSGWTALQLGCWAYALMQIPPILCWMTFGEPGFEVFGVFVSGGAGLLAHVLILVWSLLNGSMLPRMRFRSAA